MSMWKIFINGVYKENPILRLALALCPSLAVSNTALNGLAMGICLLFVMVCSEVIVSLTRKVIHQRIRVPAYLTITATIVTLLEQFLHAWFPEIHKNLGVFVALIVVFAIILARCEVFASKNSVGKSFFDGLGMGTGFLLSMVIIGMIRELFGSGSIFGQQIMFEGYQPVLILVLSPGAFLVVGLLMGFINWIERKFTPKGVK
ncbi:electron transport complex subunit RsxE [bacterium]|nr:electron transport complex subunit RsxE [bacterium]MBU0899866.1 electron transport complex subunit RsxE [bacterium]MBU1153022.1 electron transport complex subunit RsxE [bacterium]MBU1782087.1 electron transport complex subunit RsxE [bacterium]MBU2599789.1 electron transport complex subunit RsxE [bacterium]